MPRNNLILKISLNLLVWILRRPPKVSDLNDAANEIIFKKLTTSGLDKIF